MPMPSVYQGLVFTCARRFKADLPSAVRQVDDGPLMHDADKCTFIMCFLQHCTCASITKYSHMYAVCLLAAAHPGRVWRDKQTSRHADMQTCRQNKPEVDGIWKCLVHVASYLQVVPGGLVFVRQSKRPPCASHVYVQGEHGGHK